MDTTILIAAKITSTVHVEWLKAAVNSALGQGKIIIAYNNCTVEVPKFAKKATVYTIEAVNLAAVRNFLVKQVKSPYFLFLDADDLLVEGSVALMEDYIKTVPEKRYIYGGTLIFGAGEMEVPARDFDCEALTQGVYFTNGVLQPIQNMKIVGDWDENLSVLEDKEWWLRAAEKEVIGVPLKEHITYKYRQHPESLVAKNLNTAAYSDAKDYIANLHTAFFQGVYPMCCGNKVNITDVIPPETLPAGDGQLQLRYMLGTANVTYWGAITGTRYVVSAALPLINVNTQDALTNNSRKPGLLELRKNNKPVFTVA